MRTKLEEIYSDVLGHGRTGRVNSGQRLISNISSPRLLDNYFAGHIRMDRT
jgi:hypothetical protein